MMVLIRRVRSLHVEGFSHVFLALEFFNIYAENGSLETSLSAHRDEQMADKKQMIEFDNTYSWLTMKTVHYKIGFLYPMSINF